MVVVADHVVGILFVLNVGNDVHTAVVAAAAAAGNNLAADNTLYYYEVVQIPSPFAAAVDDAVVAYRHGAALDLSTKQKKKREKNQAVNYHLQ